MPHIIHDAAVFVVYPPWEEHTKEMSGPEFFEYERGRIIEALATVPDEYQYQIVGPAGGTNGYYSVAVLPSGGSPRAFDHTAAFEAVWAALKDVDPDLEAVRFTFGGDDMHTEVRFTTDEVVRVVEARPIPDPRGQFLLPEGEELGTWSRVQHDRPGPPRSPDHEQ